MSFADLKAKVITPPKTEAFEHISNQYTLPEGWYNEDRPTERVYKNDLFPGEEFYSATTMLGKLAAMTGEDQWIKNWVAQVGEEEAARISKEATDRGTAMHAYLEDYLHGREVIGKHHQGYLLFQQLKPWCDERIDAVIASEHALYSRRLRVAGRVDLIAMLDGNRNLDLSTETLVDFKSSRKIKSEEDIAGYRKQVTLYQMMAHETTGMKIEIGEIWMSCWNDGNPVPKKFEVIFGNHREQVIDLLADYWKSVGNPYENVNEIKEFFI